MASVTTFDDQARDHINRYPLVPLCQTRRLRIRIAAVMEREQVPIQVKRWRAGCRVIEETDPVWSI
jgi:hypothetical protein